MTKEELIAFEQQVAGLFNDAAIRAPVHLSGGNEDQLIEIFQQVRPQDWVFSTWRSHYHALLHGVPAGKVMSAIMAGRSITLCFPEHRFFSSAILGGHIPIALGVALGIKRDGGNEIVWCFLGDMAEESGIYHECCKYAQNFQLPIRFVVECNGKSVCTDTVEVWHSGAGALWLPEFYFYELPWPHSGAGKRVNF